MKLNYKLVAFALATVFTALPSFLNAAALDLEKEMATLHADATWRATMPFEELLENICEDQWNLERHLAIAQHLFEENKTIIDTPFLFEGKEREIAFPTSIYKSAAFPYGGCTPLTYACRRAKGKYRGVLIQTIEWLLAHDAHVEEVDRNGKTPLMVTSDDADIQAILLEKNHYN